MQRICIVPKTSKSHCEGDRILTKECNMDPCPSNELNINDKQNISNSNNQKGNFTNISNDKKEEINDKIKNKSVLNPPEIKFMPISKRPNSYERCIKKEGDLAIYINDGYMKGSKIPARVLLNKKTLTVYSSDVIN